MAYVIDKDKCTGCGACADSCPVEAIAQAGDVYAINAEECIDCGACEGTCAFEAISQE